MYLHLFKIRPILVVCVALFVLLQYQLWFASGGILAMHRLHHVVGQQEVINQALEQENADLMVDIRDLQHGNASLEEHARNDFGMIKKGEVFYQVVGSPPVSAY